MKFETFKLKIKDMKKKIFSLVVLLIVGCVVIISCKEGPLDPPIKKFSITTSVINGIGGKIICPTEVVSGAVLEISTEADPGYVQKTIIVNGITSLMPNKNYTISSASDNYNIAVSFEKTTEWYVMNKTWNQDSIAIKNISSGKWSRYPSSDKDSVVFKTDHNYDIYRNSKHIGDGKWSLAEANVASPTTLNFGGTIWNILVDESSLKMWRDNVDGDTPGVLTSVEIKYTHH
jgi:hypothetical protein